MSARPTAVPVGVALGIAVGAEAVLLLGGSHAFGWAGLALVLVATAAWAFASWDERIEARPHVAVAAIALALLVAVAVPPRQSRDLWSYAEYGRLVSVHHANPYLHPPSDYPGDVFFRQVGRGWRHARSVYGPLFTGGSAVLVRAAGDSVLRARLAFQGLAAVAAAGALLLVWRATRSVRALVFLGLHPVLVIAVVNNGHNDALVGLAVLAAALLVARRRWSAAGLVLGLGLLVKASTGLGALGLVVWAFRRDRRGAVRLALVAAATTVIGYLPAGTAAIRAVGHAGNDANTRASVWDALSLAFHTGPVLGLGVALVLAAVGATIYAAASRPARTAVATITAYLVAGAYVLPSYALWALPSASVQRRTKLSMLVAAQAAFLVAVYQFEPPAHPMLTGFASVVRTEIVQIGAWLAVVAYVLLLVRAGRRAAPVPVASDAGT